MPIKKSSTAATAARIAFSYSRVSSAKQAGEGRAGLDRQGDAFLGFCEKHGLTPNPDPLVERGLSAFHGRHRSKGVLGAFIESAKAGQVPPGAVLVVEDLDRFSRESASLAEQLIHQLWDLDLALGIVRDDVVVDRARYDSDLGIRVQLLTRRDAAHDYSKKLSSRIVDVWERRRRDWLQHGRRYLSKANRPFWLADDGSDFVVLEPEAEVVRLMFRLSAHDNMGSTQIAERLQRESVRPPRVKVWSAVRVNRLLEDRRVIGEKLWKDGTTSTGYFPAIISAVEFEANIAARKGRDARKGRHGRGDKIANIFQGMVFCACGKAMSYHLGKGRDGRYHYENLRCTGRRDKVCDQPPGDYPYDEQALLEAFMDQHWEKFLGRSSATGSQQRALQKRLSTLELQHAKDTSAAERAAAQAAQAIEAGTLTAEGANLFAGLQSKALAAAEATQAELDAARAELTALKAMPTGAEAKREIKARTRAFMEHGRFDLEQRRAFNNWALGLGIKITVLEAKLGRLQWGGTDAVVYVDPLTGNICIDESLADAEAFGFGEFGRQHIQGRKSLPPEPGVVLRPGSPSEHGGL